MSETAISRAIRERLALERGVLVWRNNTGKLRDIKGRWVTFGLGIGSADLIGIVTVAGHTETTGRFFALEVKVAGNERTKEQTWWAEAVVKLGGFVAVVRSVDDAVDAVNRCRDGQSE